MQSSPDPADHDPAQVQAITAMKLTRQDMYTEMSSLGLTNGGANGTPGFSFTPRAGGALLAVPVVVGWWWFRLPWWRRRRWRPGAGGAGGTTGAAGQPRTQPDRLTGAVCQSHTHGPDERPGLFLAEDRRFVIP